MNQLHLFHAIGLKLPVQILWRLLLLNRTLRQIFTNTFWQQRGSVEFPLLPAMVGRSYQQYFIDRSRSGYGDLYINNQYVEIDGKVKQVFLIDNGVFIWTKNESLYHLDLSRRDTFGWSGSVSLVESKVNAVFRCGDQLMFHFPLGWRMLQQGSFARVVSDITLTWKRPTTVKSVHYNKDTIGETVLYLTMTGELFCCFHPNSTPGRWANLVAGSQPLYERLPRSLPVVEVLDYHEGWVTLMLLDGTIEVWTLAVTTMIYFLKIGVFPTRSINIDDRVTEILTQHRRFDDDGRLVIDSGRHGSDEYIIV